MGCGTSNTAAVAAQASDSSIVDSEEKKEQAWSNKKGGSSYPAATAISNFKVSSHYLSHSVLLSFFFH